MKKYAFLFTALTMLFSINLSAQRTTDYENAKDYPLVSRFKGSVIQWYELKNFDRYYLLDLNDQKLSPREIDGKITRIQYAAGKDHSIVEISRSYETALKNAGFNILVNLDEQNSPANLNEQLYFGEFDGLNKLPGGSVKPDHNNKWNYLEAAGQKDDKDIYIVIYITDRDWPLITFDAIEVKKMDSGLVTAQKIDKGISAEGHIVLDGIYFDTGKSTIKPESEMALKNVADYLKKHQDQKFLIVGHTDNSGDFDSNIELSRDRAKSVINELISKYDVDGNQLESYGAGPVSPVVSNSTDAGKAKNRRVEIVER